MAELLTVKDLSVAYGDEKVLEKLSFSLEKGEALAIIGPNGAGKTTLFRVLLGTIPYQGAVMWADGVRVGYVPQRISFDKDLPITVEEFFKLHAETEHPKHAYSVHDALDLVHLPKSFLKKTFTTLSSGEAQRVLIAWALLDKPNVLLFDEPTANVDIAGQETVYELVHSLQDSHELTLLLISHDLSIVYRYATKVLCVNRDYSCFGEPKEVLKPEELEKLYSGGKTFYHHLHDEVAHH